MESTAGPNLLTAEQAELVDLCASTRALVNAAAGTGKTFALVERLAGLVDAQGLFPGSQILVLSFSRAAVSEIRKRSQRTGGSAALVGAMTFDAFATRLLAIASDSEAWKQQSYDDRIRSATRLIAEQHDDPWLAGLRHVLVDEIQDLVGPRANLVTTLLKALRPDAGFTLFGDPAQRIYDYQIDERDPTTSADLYAFVRAGFGSVLRELSLTKNFRAVGAAPRAVLDFSPRLQVAEPEYAEIKPDLEGFLLDLPPLGDLRAVIPAWRDDPPSSDAILCRSNGEVLAVMRHLVAAGVRCRVRGDKVERAAAAWIAKSLAGYEGARIGRKAMFSRLTACAFDGAGPVDLERRWRYLKLLDGRRGSDLDVRTVAARVRDGMVPQELLQDEAPGVLISTVHRAKGLEFEKVIVLPFDLDAERGDWREEVRIAYVALTRARRWISRMTPPDMRGIRIDHRIRRWVQVRFEGKRRRVEAIEVRPFDSDWSLPPGVEVNGERSPDEVRSYVERSVRSGDQVRLSRLGSRSQPGYLILHEGCSVGRMTRGFVDMLQVASPSGLPCSIDGLTVESVATVAGNPDEGRRAGQGSTGLWLAVRLNGLGRLCFDPSKQEKTT